MGDPADEPAVSPRLRSIIHDQSDRTQLLPRGAHGSMSVRHFKNPRPPRLPSRGAQCPRTPRGLRWGGFDPPFEWNGRHNVTVSKDNKALFTAYRNFFDRPTAFGNGNPLSPRQSRVLLGRHPALDSRIGLEPMRTNDGRPNTVR